MKDWKFGQTEYFAEKIVEEYETTVYEKVEKEAVEAAHELSNLIRREIWQPDNGNGGYIIKDGKVVGFLWFTPQKEFEIGDHKDTVNFYFTDLDGNILYMYVDKDHPDSDLCLLCINNPLRSSIYNHKYDMLRKLFGEEAYIFSGICTMKRDISRKDFVWKEKLKNNEYWQYSQSVLRPILTLAESIAQVEEVCPE